LKERHARLEHKLYFSLNLDGIERLIKNSESDKPTSPKAGTQLSRKLESNFRESDKTHFDIRNKRVTRELQESCNKEEAQAPLILPDWINQQTWSDYKDMRKKIRKPMTLAAETLAIKRLTALKDEGQDPQQVMEQSILNSWQSFYPVKRDNGRERQAEGELSERTKRILRRGLT
jgi:hypothetical protein